MPIEPAIFSEFPSLFAFGYSRIDPALIFALGFTTLGSQALVWGIARDSADIEWWRAGAIAAIITVVSMLVLGLVASEETLAIGPLIAAMIGCAFAVWLAGGFLYDLETWQRAVLAAASPLMGTVASLAGIWLRNALLGGLVAG